MPDTKAHATVVVPSLAGRALRPGVRRWLSRASLSQQAARLLDLDRVLQALSLPLPSSGYAALRLWGQTGERPAIWVAAADPAFLEARLDHVHLQSLDDPELPRADLRRIYDDLQQALCTDGPDALARVGKVGYLRGETAMASATVPPELIDGERIDPYLPAGKAADSYLALSGEIQLCLHQHPVNVARESAGLRPVNTLWIWGGGHAPTLSLESPLPPLFSSDPLLRGYWLCAGAASVDSLGSAMERGEESGKGFVATLAQDSTDAELDEAFDTLRRRLRRSRISRVTIVCRNGTVASVRRSDRYRFWRRNAARVVGGSA